MTKREFIMQYALNRAIGNRAIGHVGGLHGPAAVIEGAKAWDELEKQAPEPKFPPVDPDSSAVTETPKFNV
jgi:hypothetical protein